MLEFVFAVISECTEFIGEFVELIEEVLVNWFFIQGDEEDK